MQFTTLSLLATGAHAATVLMTNNAMLGGTKEGWNTTVWSVNTRTGSSQLVADTFDQRPAQTGVVCNNVYYSVWADMAVGFGLRALDLASGESSDLATSSLFHVLACDPKDESKLLGTASDFTSTQGTGVGVGDAPFHLKSYDPASQTEVVVGTFPSKEVKWGGYDGIFSFTQDGSEVWAAWPRDECPGCPNAKKGGHVHIMDTSSGEIKTSSDIAFSGKKGTPYFLLPDAKRGVFFTKGQTELKWADLDVADGRIKAKIGSTDASGLWASSAPPQMCGSHLLAFSKGDVRLGASVLNEISPADGLIINAVNLLTTLDIEGQPETDIKAVACLEPPTEDFALV